MEDFSPYRGYHPEDEYEPIEPVQTGEGAPTETPAEPQELPNPPAQEAYPTYQAPYPPAYPQPPYPAQAPYGYPQAPAYPPYPQSAPCAQPEQPVPPVQPAAPQSYAQPSANSYPYPSEPYQAPPVQVPNRPIQPIYPAHQPYPPRQGAPAPSYPTAPAQNPYQQSGNPYAQPQPAANVPYRQPQQKQRMNTGTLVFILILCALLLAMVIGFGVYIAHSVDSKHPDRSSNNSSIIGDDEDDNGLYPDFFNNYGYNNSLTEVEDTITLKADNGETQQRDDDNEASVGEPDEKASGITLAPLPKDAADEKYTTQSAYDSVSDSVVTVMCYEDEITDNEKDIQGQGTGTIISEDGYIVTNAHVIGNSKYYAINIVLNNSDTYQAKVVGYDTWTDLAVLKIDAENLKPVTFGDSELINVGDEVIAIGSPGGVKFQNSLTKGIVSAVDRELSINKYVRYIQSDAAISPGNSGGPLCNIYGQVIGITTAKTIATNFENMSFSIPSDTVEEIVGDLIHYGYVKGRCRIGLSGSEVTQEDMAYYGYPQGVIIGSIDENGSLAGTDLQEGDIITELDGEEITSFQDIYDVLADHKPGDKVTIKAERPQ